MTFAFMHQLRHKEILLLRYYFDANTAIPSAPKEDLERIRVASNMYERFKNELIQNNLDPESRYSCDAQDWGDD